MRRTLVTATTLLLALGGVAAAGPASAATPTPVVTATTYVDYSGTETTTEQVNGTLSATLSSTARVECATGECLLESFVIDDSQDGAGKIDLVQGQRFVLDHGKGTFAVSAKGTLCDDVSIPAGTLITEATTTGITLKYTGDGEEEQHCPDGSSVQSAPFVLTATLAVSGGTPCVVDSSCLTPTPTPAATVAPLTAAGGHYIPPSQNRAANVPSVLSALPTIASAVTARNSLWGAAAAVVLVLLVAFPTYFFNQAAGRANELFERWWKRRRANATVASVSDAAGRVGKRVALAGWPAAAGGVVAASIISAFIDPSFGFDAASLRSFLSILLSFAVDVVIGWFLLVLVVRATHPNSTARFEFKPLTLLIVLVAVIFTRVTHFEPGIVFGLVAGVVFGGLLATADRARVALIGVAYSFGIGVLAWVGYSLILWNQGDRPGALTIFFRETLSGIAIAGTSSLPIALLPVRGLTGASLWAWKKWVWGLAYAVGLFAFFVMLMPMPFSWESVPINLIVWLACYLVYALVAVGLWLGLTRPWKKSGEPESDEVAI